MTDGRPGAPESLKRKLYQLIIPRLEGDRIGDPAYRRMTEELVRCGVGGFIVFGGDLGHLPDFLDHLHLLSEEPLFIASDIERGAGQQVRGATSFPCPMAFAAAIDRDDPEDSLLLSSCLKAVAAEARAIGINMPLLPVLDVNRNTDNPIVCTRAFSDRPDVAAWFGEFFVRVLEGEGLLCCAKHFPGHGDTAVDSHLSLPVINKTIEALRREDLPPFEQAVRAGVSCVMIGHLAVTSLDGRPASLSARVIGDLLRRDLGFDGLVLTDALNMGGLAGVCDVAAASFKAGADILLHPLDPHTAVRELLSALDSGGITEARIDQSLARIREKKQGIRGAHRASGVDVRDHRLLSSAVTERSVTIVKRGSGSLPLGPAEEVAVTAVGEVPAEQSSLFTDSFHRVADADSLLGNPGALAGSTVLVAAFTSVAAWRGTSGISGEDVRKVKAVIASGARTIVISFGSPYVLSHFRAADVLIAAYEATEAAQSAVIRALRGEVPFRGRLPVTLP